MTILALRASAMPLAFKCAGSVRLPVLRVAETHEAATLGTAVHAALRPLAEGRGIDWDSLPALADNYGVEFAELRLLVAIGSKLWHQVAESFPEAMTEIDVCAILPGGIELPGHIDVLSFTDDGCVARFGDWKSGRKDGDYEHQIRAYAAGLFADNVDLREATGTVFWLRDSAIENYTITRTEAFAWCGRVEREIVQWDQVFRPGSHCEFCPRSHECDAANAMVRRDVAALSDKALVARAECELEKMAPTDILSLYEKASLVENFAGRVRAAVKAHVAARGTVTANGLSLQLESEPRRKLDPLLAWPVLEAAGFRDEDFAATMTLGISKVEKLVASKAGKGKGAGAVRQIASELEAAGAVSLDEITKLRVFRSKP